MIQCQQHLSIFVSSRIHDNRSQRVSFAQMMSCFVHYNVTSSQYLKSWGDRQPWDCVLNLSQQAKNITFYYINTNEIPGELLRENLISSHVKITCFILLHEKFLEFDWLRAVAFQLNLKYLHVKITNLLPVVV